jgi:HK97 family phage major capsid protein
MTITRPEREARVAELALWLADQAQEFDDLPMTEWPREVRHAWKQHEEELARHRAVLDQAAARDRDMIEGARSGRHKVESGDGRRIDDLDSDQGTRLGRVGRDLRDSALRAVERLDRLPDACKEYATREIEQDQDIDQRLARVTVALADPDYFRAFTKWHNDPLTGMHLWTPKERDAVSRAKILERSFGLGAQGGGFLVPYELDPAIVLANAGSVDPMRAVSRVTTTAYNTKKFVTSVGATASWDAEFAEVSDDSPTLLQPSIDCFKGQTYIQHSYELLEDSDISQQVGAILADSKLQLESNAYTLGVGGTTPKGIITALVAAGGATVIATGTNVLATADLYNNQALLPARWRQRAKWMMNLSIINGYRQLPQAIGLNYSIINDNTAPPTSLGWQVIENSAMDGALTGAAADYSLLSGDFQQFAIIDRIGATIIPNPVVIGASRRPTGEFGWWLHWRTGSDVLVADAFRLSNSNT